MVKLPKIDPGKTMNFKTMILILNPSVKKEVQYYAMNPYYHGP